MRPTNPGTNGGRGMDDNLGGGPTISTIFPLVYGGFVKT